MDSYPYRQLPLWTATLIDSYPYGQLPLWTATLMDSYPHRQLPLWTATHMDSYPHRQLPTSAATNSSYSCTCTVHFSQLAQVAHVRAVARASGSGGGPQADPPLVTSRATLTCGAGLPSGPCRSACGPSSSYLLIDGLHRAHRPLSHQANTSLQASSSAYRPTVYRLLAPLGRTRY